ncbi:MAG: DUF6476 family protein [Hyphomicrobiaceae bacterium]
MNIQHEAAGSGSTQSTDPFSPAQLRILKIAVVVMGVILVLGFAAVIGRIAYLVTRTAKPAAVQSATIAKDMQLLLPAGAAVRSLALSGDRLAVHFDTHAGAGVTILDLLTGEPVTRIELVPHGSGR